MRGSAADVEVCSETRCCTTRCRRFCESPNWLRYKQWKQLELNMTVNAKDFDIHRILGRGGYVQLLLRELAF
jgi:hypothetical protein